MMTTSPPIADMPLINRLRSRRLPSRKRRREIRESAGASIREVAEACGVSHFAVYSWEVATGTIEPKPEHRVIYKRVLEQLEAFAHETANTQE